MVLYKFIYLLTSQNQLLISGCVSC